MTSLLAFLLTFAQTGTAQDIKELNARQTLIQSGAPVGNHCVQCASGGMTSTVSFTESGWTCPNGHVGFLRSHRCGIQSCAMKDFVR